MQNKLSDTDLNLKVKTLAQNEKLLLSEILTLIAEVDSRKLYLKMGYPNLFTYLTLEVGYSAGCAQRRIDSARLLQKVPELKTKIEEGSVNLSQLSQVQKSIRQVEKEKGVKVAVEEKKEIVTSIEKKTYRETEVLLARKFDLPVVIEEKKVFQKDESVRLTLTLSQDEAARLEEAAALLSNAVPSGQVKDILNHLVSEFLKTKQKSVERAVKRLNQDSKSEPPATSSKALSPLHSTAASAVKHPSQVPAFDSPVLRRIKLFVLHRDKTCQYKNPRTGRVCGSRHYLHIDHIKRRMEFGSNHPDNLRILCAAHNLRRG